MNIKVTQLLFLMSLHITVIAMDKDAVKSANLSSLVKCKADEFTQKINVTPSFINLIDTEGKNILHHAADAANFHVITILMGKGMSASVQDKEGNTPVHLIRCDYQMPYQINKCTKALLGLRPKYEYPDAWNNYQLLSVKNKKEQTPVDMVLYYRNLPVISIFYRLALDWFARLSSQRQEWHLNIAQEIKDKIEAKFHDDECLRVRIILHSDAVIKRCEEEIERLQKEKEESDKKNTTVLSAILKWS